MENELNEVAMHIIIHAGDARNKAHEALRFIKEYDFETAYKIMENAEELIVEAHKSQTNVIQEFAGGKEVAFNLLFIHAQDTLMTIKSEISMFTELIKMVEQLHKEINK